MNKKKNIQRKKACGKNNDKCYFPMKKLFNEFATAVDMILRETQVLRWIDFCAGDILLEKTLSSLLRLNNKEIIEQIYVSDLYPENKGDFPIGAIQADFYDQIENFLFKSGDCLILPPPFGYANSLAREFTKLSFNTGVEYILGIMPAEFRNWTNNLYSDKYTIYRKIPLGNQNFRYVDSAGIIHNHYVNCYIIIYKKLKEGEQPDIKPIDINFSWLEIIKEDRDNFKNLFSDLMVIRHGGSRQQKKIYTPEEYEEQYNYNSYKQLYKIVINLSDLELKQQIIDFLKNADWYDIVGPTTSNNFAIYHYHIKNEIAKYFPYKKYPQLYI